MRPATAFAEAGTPRFPEKQRGRGKPRPWADPWTGLVWEASNPLTAGRRRQFSKQRKGERQRVLTRERTRVRVIAVNVEKTIEFILGQEARAEARLEKAMERMDRADKRMALADKRMDRAMERMDRADKRADRADKRLDRLERVVAQTNRVVMGLVRYGVSLRSDVRRHDKAILRIEAAVENIEGAIATLAASQRGTDSRLNTLIKLVDRTLRRNGRF